MRLTLRLTPFLIGCLGSVIANTPMPLSLVPESRAKHILNRGQMCYLNMQKPYSSLCRSLRPARV